MDINNFMGQFKQFMGNPMQYMTMMKLNIPREYMNSPDDAIQYLMNTGKLSQEQYNYLNRRAKEIQNDPNFKQMMGIK